MLEKIAASEVWVLQTSPEKLGQGKKKLADALIAEIESSGQPTIEGVARAAFERGRIVYQEVHWQEARSHFEKGPVANSRTREAREVA